MSGLPNYDSWLESGAYPEPRGDEGVCANCNTIYHHEDLMDFEHARDVMDEKDYLAYIKDELTLTEKEARNSWICSGCLKDLEEKYASV